MPGIERVSMLTIAVRDQEEALQWFIERVGFEKRSDNAGEGMRWLTIAPKRQREVELVLASWFPDQVGKNPPCVLETHDCRKTFSALRARGVPFVQEPAEKPYGVEAVFQDLYGNPYALVQREAWPGG
jgi:predicted enzyme related to lactoylglutathione lyase